MVVYMGIETANLFFNFSFVNDSLTCILFLFFCNENWGSWDRIFLYSGLKITDWIFRKVPFLPLLIRL